MSGIIGKLDSRIIKIIFLYALGNKTIFPDYRSTGELRVKETDRIKAMVQGLKYCGVDVQNTMMALRFRERVGDHL